MPRRTTGNLILCIAGHSALANSEGEKKNEERKEEKKCRKKRWKQKSLRPAQAARVFVAAIVPLLSAAPAGVKDGRGQQCTAEFSRAISPQAKGERTAASLLAKQP